MIPIGNRVKVLIPGYRKKCCLKYSIMLQHIRNLLPKIKLGEEGNIPWLEFEDEKFRFYGFWSGQKEIVELYLFGKFFPKEIPSEFYRIVKDYITRFQYSHLMPSLTPTGINNKNWGGFHGQHKETFNAYQGIDASKLKEIFSYKNDEVVINGGSFIGFGDMYLSRILTKGHIYSLEADSDCFRVLEKNLIENNIGNVTPVNRALWNDVVEIEMESGPAQANSLVKEVVIGDKKKIVKTITIDTLAEQMGISRIDMMSLTLNGAEVETLNGANKILSEFRPRIRLAGWYSRNGFPIFQHAQKILKPFGYNTYVTPRGNVLAIHSDKL